jgi:predicted small lipoprotein YifL
VAGCEGCVSPIRDNLVWCRSIEERLLSRPSFRPDPARFGARLFAVALLGAAGFALGACGVKGAVEPPPSARLAPAAAEAPSAEASRSFDPLGDAYAGPNATQRVITSGRAPSAAANAPAARKSSALDWLVD